MTLPSSSSHDSPAPGTTGSNQSSSARAPRPQQLAWGSSNHQQGGRRGLTPISTAFTSAPTRASASSSPSRNAFSPIASNFSSGPSASGRQIVSRTSSASSTSSPFSPSQSGPQQLPSHQLLSSARSRTIASSSNASLASSAAALPAASQGGGGGPSGGGGIGGAAKLARASPSLTQSAVGSPIAPANSSGQASGQNLSKIVVAQVFLLLSTIKEDRDKVKWESQAEQIRKVRVSACQARKRYR